MTQGQVAGHAANSWLPSEIGGAQLGKVPIAVLGPVEVEAAGTAHAMQLLQAICLPNHFPQPKSAATFFKSSHYGCSHLRSS